jgi:hypothetical protein
MVAGFGSYEEDSKGHARVTQNGGPQSCADPWECVVRSVHESRAEVAPNITAQLFRK